MSRINSDMAPALDYSQEARDLWGRLGEAEAECQQTFYIFQSYYSGINPEEVNQKKGFNRVYNPVDIIFKSKAGGCIFVGKTN